MPEMTERQAAAWPEAVADINRWGDVDLPTSLHNWDITWEDEVRPGRGHALNATYNDGEHFAQILMDVYGAPSGSVAELTWLHASAHEECECGCRDANDDDPVSPISGSSDG